MALRALADIGEVGAGADLAATLASAAPADLGDEDVVVVAHKVVSKAEGRTVAIDSVEPGERAIRLGRELDRDPRIVQLILDESSEVIRAERGVLICRTRQGLVCANAGLDQSNVPEGIALLLPLDADASARGLRAGLRARLGVAPAVVVTDSFGRAWRQGQVDVAIGAAGLTPLDDWRGRRDGHGRVLTATRIAIADAVAAAADLVRSKDAGQPAVLVRGLGRFVSADDGPGAAALRRPVEEDLFG